MENIKWIFSGIGVVILSWAITRLSKFLSEKNKYKERKGDKEYFDDSKFISEYPPDGINVLVGTSFVKKWTIQNCGNIIWKNRKLKCISDVPDSFYPEKREMKIPILEPGEQYSLKVKYYADVEGEFFSQWKMFDDNNEMIFPKKRGLGVFVRVVKEKEYTQR